MTDQTPERDEKVCRRCGGAGETLAYDVCPECDGDGVTVQSQSKQGEERWATCAECGDTGLMSALAPCTTFGSDCACNGPRIEVPCEFCGVGEGRA